jgi:hypothetical protein
MTVVEEVDQNNEVIASNMVDMDRYLWTSALWNFMKAMDYWEDLL